MEQPIPNGQPQGLAAGAPPSGGQIPEANFGKAPDPNAQPVGDGQQEEATPEEQETYNRFVTNSLVALYDEAMLPKTLERLKQGDPIQAAGEVASSIALRVFADAKDKGTTVHGDILMNAGKEIVEATIELAEQAGVKEFSPDAMEATFYVAVQEFGKSVTASGEYSEGTAREDVDLLNQSADSGEMEKVMAQAGAVQREGA